MTARTARFLLADVVVALIAVFVLGVAVGLWAAEPSPAELQAELTRLITQQEGP